MKNHVINTWREFAYVSFPGEHILAASFFQSMKRFIALNDKPEQCTYFDKFSRDKKFLPSVSKIGGIGANGCLILTSTGMLGSFFVPDDIHQTLTEKIKLEIVTESLGLTRCQFTTADIYYGKRNFYVVATNVNSKPTVLQCFKVQTQLQDDKLIISSSALPSFFAAEGKGICYRATTLFTVKWCLREEAENIIIVLNHASGTLVEMFSLKEQVKQLRKTIQGSKCDNLKTLVWIPTQFYQYNFNITSLEISYGSSNSGFIYISTTDNILHCLRTDTLKDTCKAPINTKEIKTNDAKYPRVSYTVKSLSVTHMGYMLFAMNEQNEIFVYRVSVMLREPYINYMHHMVNALEYSIINGNDYLDVLLIIKNQSWDAIVEKLNENFNRQCQSVQQFFYVNFLVVKTNIYRMANLCNSKAQDLNNLLMLHSILIAFKSLLRPSDLSSAEGPAEKLALALSESIPDVDKVLMNVEAKEFTVETTILQSLKQLIQWVADLALNILARLPDNKIKPQGYDISRDIVALNSIRELVVMIRIWGLLKPQCLPTFTRSSDNQDILATIYRLLTKLALNPNEPDEMLLDECCALPSQVLIPTAVHNNTTKCGLITSSQTTSLPLFFMYHEDEDLFSSQSEIQVGDEGISCEAFIDFTSYLHFDKLSNFIRKCTRCGTYTNTACVSRTAAMRAWEQRWPFGCRCGGFWRTA